MGTRYGMTTAEMSDIRANLKWSGKKDVPAIGTKVKILFNGLGEGHVQSYFFEHGYLGVQVGLLDEPDWHRKQCAGTSYEGKALVFGAEIEF